MTHARRCILGDARGLVFDAPEHGQAGNARNQERRGCDGERDDPQTRREATHVPPTSPGAGAARSDSTRANRRRWNSAAAWLRRELVGGVSMLESGNARTLARATRRARVAVHGLQRER